jgi:hypothetical protein
MVSASSPGTPVVTAAGTMLATKTLVGDTMARGCMTPAAPAAWSIRTIRPAARANDPPSRCGSALPMRPSPHHSSGVTPDSGDHQEEKEHANDQRHDQPPEPDADGG